MKKPKNGFKNTDTGLLSLNRFLPTVRSVISIVSGISELNTTKVFFFSLISASAWNLIWIQTGYLLGHKWHTVKEKFTDIIMKYNIIAGIILISIIIIFLIIRKFRNKTVD